MSTYEKARATEVDTRSSAAPQGAILAHDELKGTASITSRATAAMRLVWLVTDIFGYVPIKRPTVVERYREAQACEAPEGPLCIQCLEVPPAHANRCWDCNLGRRLT